MEKSKQSLTRVIRHWRHAMNCLCFLPQELVKNESKTNTPKGGCNDTEEKYWEPYKKWFWNVSWGKLELEVHSLVIASVRDDGGLLSWKLGIYINHEVLGEISTYEWVLHSVRNLCNGYWQTGSAPSHAYKIQLTLYIYI
jgi:hypothetical protein